MRKKVFSVLTFIFLLLTCFGISACKGKYDDMQFRVFYAYSEDSDNWLDGTNGINCYYGDGENYLQPGADGTAKIFVRIEVENVKSKNLDNIYVSSVFITKTVAVGEVFSFEVSGKVSDVIKILETNSQKSMSINVNVSVELEGIEANLQTNPSVVVGESLDLSKYNENNGNSLLNFYPLDSKGKSLTNQTAVTYAVTGVGRFDQANTFIAQPNISNVRLEGSNLYIGNQFVVTQEHYAVEITATSVDKPNMENGSAKFYVYVLPDLDFSPVVNYKNGADVVPVNEAITLYHDSAYSMATLSINSRYNGPYATGVYTKNGQAKISIKPFVMSSGREIEFGQALNDVGLVFNKNEQDYTIATTNFDDLNNFGVTFKAEIEGFDFSGTNFNLINATTVQINKAKLPTSLNINNETFDNVHNKFEGTIYSVNGQQTPIQLNLQINNPLNNSQAIVIDGFNNFQVTPAPEVDGGTSTVANNSLIKVVFANETATKSSFNLRVRSNPEKFQGLNIVGGDIQYITITVELTRVVTADSFVVYKDADFSVPLALNGVLDVATGENNKFYLRVYYTGTNFDSSSVDLISEDENIKFTNNSQNLKLNEISYLKTGTEGNKSYNDYAINFGNILDLTNSNLLITAAEGQITYRFVVAPRVVTTLNVADFTIDTVGETEDATKINTVSNGHINFAIVFNRLVNFAVSGKDVNGNTANVIYNITQLNYAGLSNDNFTNSALNFKKVSQSQTLFSLRASRDIGKTQIIQIAVDYYSNANGYVELMTGDRAAVITAEFAIYLPISEIELTVESEYDALTYVNSSILDVQDYSTATINYVAKSAIVGKDPSSKLIFSNGETDLVEIANPNKIQLTFSNAIDESMAISISYNGNAESNNATGAILNNLSGKITVSLTNSPRIDSLQFMFKPTAFNNVVGEAKSVSIRFENCAVADDVMISGNDLSYEGVDSNGEDINYIYLSYLGVDELSTIEKSFNATASYESSNSNSFKLNKLGYELYKATTLNNETRFDLVSNVGIDITIANNMVDVAAHKSQNNKNGGVYRLDIFSLDSYSNGVYSALRSVYLRISDGTRENPYALSNETEFKAIETNLDANFVLMADFTIEDSIAGEFSGSLTGVSTIIDKDGRTYTTNHTLTIELNKVNVDSQNNYIGLFQTNNGIIENLNIVLKYNLDNVETTMGDVYVGGLVGLNKRTITNVSVQLADYTSINFNNLMLNNENNLFFGLIAGANSGSINVDAGNVTVSSLTLNLTKDSNYQIGLIAGQNKGNIVGIYGKAEDDGKLHLGKESLTDVAFTVVANLVVNNSSSTSKINVGAVAGENLSLISNILVGGNIEVKGEGKANLGGIVGYSNPTISTEKGIRTSAVLGLNLSNKIGAVAGIVAESDSSDIYDVKVIATEVKFGSGLTTTGKISGDQEVAGIVANSTNDTINYATVESFILKEGEGDFFALYSTTNKLAGLVYSAAGTKINASFVNANLGYNNSSNGKIYLTSNGATELGTYFVGKTQAELSNCGLNSATSYAVVYTTNELYYKNGNELTKYEEFKYIERPFKERDSTQYEEGNVYLLEDNVYVLSEGLGFGEDAYYELDVDKDKLYILENGVYKKVENFEELDALALYYLKTDWSEFIKTNLLSGVDSWMENEAAVSGLNNVTFKFNNGENLITVGDDVYFLPYLLVEGQQLRIVSPNSIKASFNKDYVVYTNSVIVDKSDNGGNDFNINDYTLSEVLLVNYFEFENGNLATEYNTHYLVNKLRTTNGVTEKSGLIDLNIDGEDGGVKFEIVYGNKAYITNDGEKIVFTGVSSEPIVVRAYSLFNSTAQSYFAIFTQYGASNLTLYSTTNNLTRSQGSDCDYELTMHSAQNSVAVSVSAENIFNAQKFKSIFSQDINNLATNNLFLSVDALDSILDINILDKTVQISIKDNANYELSKTETITLNLYLDLTANYGADYFPQVAGENQVKLIGKLNLRVSVYKATEKIELTDVANQADSESHVKFDVNLLTGYVKENDEAGSLVAGNLEVKDNVVTFKEADKDSLVLTFNKDAENCEQLNKLLAATGKSIAELFDYTISYKYYYVEGKVRGYTYSIEISLKEDFNYRYFEPKYDDATHSYSQQNLELTLTITSTTNPYASDKNLAPTLQLTFTPTQLQSARFYNYTAKSYEQSATAILQASPIESSTISPAANSYGSIMVIHLEPTYANVTSATLTCLPVNVAGVGNVSLSYEQLIYNPENNSFATLPVSSGMVENGINLRLVSEYNEAATNKMAYNGTIYVHVTVATENNRTSGFTTILTSTLTVNVLGESEPIVREKQLTTEYLPGVELSYDNNARKENGYLIQEETVNPVSITLYGYQFNNTPDISFVWNLDGEADEDGYIYGYKYKNVNGQDDRTTLVNRAGKEFKISEFVENGSLKDYTNLVAKADGSYTYVFNIYTHSNIPASFKLNAQLSVLGGNGRVESEQKNLIFYPVKYFITGVYIANLNNGMLNTVMSATHRLDLVFTTNNLNNDLSNDIYEDLIKSIKFGEKTGAEALAHAFSYTIAGYGTGYFDDSNINQFLIRYSNDRIFLTALAEVEARINLALGYSYKINEETGLYELKFAVSENAGTNSLQYSFNLIIRAGTQEDAPITISNGQEFVEKLSTAAENKDFILMDDIDLYDYNPIAATFASLDGNNKVIRIHNFNVSATVAEYGLFASIGSFTPAGSNELKSTTLKNVIVDYGQFTGLNIIKTEGISSVTFGGLVANVNAGGLIYNCDVMNLSTAEKTVNVVLTGFVNSEVNFGGLVGVNHGVITNSRVGRAGYYKISLDSTTHLNETSIWQNANPIKFVLGNSTATENDIDANGFIGIAGGFVGTNEQDGVIASSYVANTGLTNYSTRADKTNLTAGFVAENNGDVRYSYVKALESTITSSANNVRSTGIRIESAGNGNVAGFVYNNNANITNCFANTELYTDSALIAGFVYNNSESATIEACYAACTLNVKTERHSYAEQPFVAVDERQELLSYGIIKNCYYLEEEYSSYNIKIEQGKPNAAAMNNENFNKSSNLVGFVFINSDKRLESDLGVWTYYTMDTNQRHILPELTSANQIAYSYRYLVNEDENVFANAPSYILGSKNNPYIIRTAKEFNSVLTGNSGEEEFSSRIKSQTGYLRLINNISFDNVSILTRADFTFGDKINANNLTSFEGNGMTISGISLDVLEDENFENSSLEKVGLFAEVYNSYIKNLNLEFEPAEHADKNPTTPIKYSGGLAGTIDNGILINISLTGENTTLAGKNFVGGVAGIISGRSLLYDLEVNINVVSDSNTQSNIYYNLTDYTTIMRNLGLLSQNELNDPTTLRNRYNDYLSNLSYAGGVAGVLDLDRRTDTENVSNITVNADYMGERADGNIEAGFAGGIAGFAGGYVNALKLKFYVGENTTIHGSQAAGGIFAIGLGKITASQVTARENASETGQYTFDDTFAAYIKALQDNPNATLGENIGNTHLLQSEGFAGGLVGISIVEQIESCYAKSSVSLAETFGGLVGLSVGSTIFHSYAVPYVNLDNSLIKTVGGLIGEASSVMNTSTNYLDYVRYATLLLTTKTPKYTDIAYTFSTILTDNQRLLSIINGEITDSSTNTVVDITKKQINYLVGKFETNNTCHLNSNDRPINSGTTLDVFVGEVGNYNKTETDNAIKYSYGDKFELYRIYETEKSSQAELFNRVFSDWPTQYWLLNEQRYFPLLIKEDSLNYIEIKESKDFDILVSNPGLNYKIVKDINMADGGFTPNGNWIFNVNFTGTLIGDLGEGSTALPRVYGLKLTTEVQNNTAGLFRNTTGARIRNIDFIWSPYDTGTIALDMKTQITAVGGLTCNDVGSNFNNVNVYVGIYNESGKKIVTDSRYSLIDNTNSLDTAINCFGGLVGEGENTTINACSFNGNVKAKLANTSGDVYFGGLVGNGKKTSFDYSDREDYTPDEFSPERFLVMNSGVGNVNNFYTIFDISLGEYTSAYVGGAFGYAEGLAISGIYVGNKENNAAFEKINMNVAIANSENNYVGGLIGYANNSSVSSNEVLSTIVVKQNGENGDSAALDLAGLIGYYGGTEAILNSAAETTIDITKLSISSLNVAGGIAEVYTSGIVNIEQSVFTGEILSEEEDPQNVISEIVAAGVVAQLKGGENSNISLLDVLTNVNISIGTPQKEVLTGTIKLYVGGFVGKTEGNVAVNNSISAGKIVPITASDAQEIYVGGFVGVANIVNFANSISTASIIADGIAPKAIANLNIHAILGNILNDKEGNITISNVFYSSDISLFPEELCVNATNISANVLTNGSVTNDSWQQSLLASGNWQEFESGLPYLTNLADKLVKFGILTSNSLDVITEYVRGSSLKPIVLSAIDLQNGTNMSATEFNYYILNEDTINNEIFNSTIKLFGVLIAGECEYVYNPLESTTGGILTAIERHSAISNLHIKVEVEDGFTIAFSGDNIGLIAGTNDGVIFNCSVKGQGLKVKAENAGIIAGINNGLISYSYSSAEVVELEGNNLAGIAYHNGGKILSSYFTGYINNDTSVAAAGIVVEVADNSFIYNCYMAGVIVNIANNAFSAYPLENGLGANNFIDLNVNKNKVNETTDGVVAGVEVNLQTVDTQFLMANSQEDKPLLAGNWFTTAKKTETNQYYIDLTSTTYGYNYLYPIYNFYKHDSRMNLITTNYSLYTGTGSNDYVIHTEQNLSSNEYADSILKLIGSNDNRSLYTHALKVPHLGVLKAIQGISNTVLGESNTPTKTNFNYVLIYDINGQYIETTDDGEQIKNYAWRAIGSSSEQKNGFYYDNAEFNGLFISNKYYNFTASTDDKLCTIQNLSEQGIFTNIRNAYFGYVMFGSMSNLANSGAVGVSVNNAGEVFVDNLYYLNDATFSGIDGQGNYVAAMFGSVANVSSTITIKESGFTQNSNNRINLASASSAGLIVGQLNGGTINFEGGNNLRVAFTNSVSFAGGLVGEMLNGKINGTVDNTSEVTIVANLEETTNAAAKIGGLVGRVLSAEMAEIVENSINDFTVYFASEIDTSGLGGLVYEAKNSEIRFNNCQVMLENGASFTPNFINSTGADNSTFYGTICANIVVEDGFAGGVRAYNFGVASNFLVEIKLKNINSYQNDNIEDNKQGFGGLVGHMSGGTLTVSAAQDLTQTIKVRGTNVGGLIGCFEAGSIALEASINYKISLSAYNNVGGAFGLCLADLSNTIAKFVGLDLAETESWNFLKAGKEFAEIVTFDNLENVVNTISLYNWGGMFGNFLGAGLQDVENYNTITINPVRVSETYVKTGSGNPNIYNVGGIAGKINADSKPGDLKNLSNFGNILASDENSDTAKNGNYQVKSIDSKTFDIFELSVCTYAFDGDQNYYFAYLPINVGGIFGLGENATLIAASNSGTIVGYQNVGGLIGSAKSVNFAVESIEEGEAITSKVESSTIAGVVNVGGAVGLMEKSTVNANSQANVYGNYNVGGLVGFVASGTINNSFVGADKSSEQPQNVEIKGIYLRTLHYINIPEGTTADAGQFNRAANFFPTSVGGLIGATANSSADNIITITNNTVQNVLVTSSSEGILNEEKDGKTLKTFNNATTISTVDNAMLYGTNPSDFGTPVKLTEVVTIPSTFTKNDEGKISSNYLVKFNDLKTGFGGFAGSIDAASVLENVASNKIGNVEIYAMLGVNTGSIYGSYNANTVKNYSDGESVSVSHSIESPTLTADIYVEGAYNVGGIAGYIESSTGVDSINFETDLSANFVHVDVETDSETPTIHIQAHKPVQSQADEQEDTPTEKDDLIGIYVGGLFGKLKGNANGLKINGENSIKLIMTTSITYYTGGLIGRLEGNLGGSDSTLDSNIVNGKSANGKDFTADENAPLTIRGDDKTNFGGLVGMLKKTSSADDTAYVIGWQPYAFTVNTIENSNYADGETSYDYNDSDENNLYLIAQAYYVNQDNFEISYSRGGASTVGADVTTSNSTWFGNMSNNPLIPDSFGWARDYTMFKTMQRNIPQSQNGPENISVRAQWDSISVVYDASRITYVATVENSVNWYGKDIESNYEAEKIIYSLTGGKEIKENEDITIESLAEHYANDTGFKDQDNKPIKETDQGHYKITDNLESFKNHIFYTIYEDTEGNPTLYSRTGIATAYKNQNEFATPQTEIAQLDDSNTAFSYYGNVYYDNISGSDAYSMSYSTASYFTWIMKGKKSYGEEADESVIDINYSTSFNYVLHIDEKSTTQGGGKDLPGGIVQDMRDLTITLKENTVELKKHFAYSVKNTIYNPGKDAVTWFVYQTIFENFSTNLKNDNDNVTTNFSDENIPVDGSIFNVSGLITENAIKNKNLSYKYEDSGWSTWGIVSLVLAAVATVLALAVSVATGGAGSPLLAFASSAFVAAVKFATFAALATAIGSAVSFVGFAVTGITALVQHFQNANKIALETTFQRQDRSYGFVSSTYNREIFYEHTKNGWKMASQTDESKPIDNDVYLYYTSIRPSDYYNNYYLIVDSKEDTTNPVQHVAKSEIKDIEYEEIEGHQTKMVKSYMYKGEQIKVEDSGKMLAKTYQYLNGVYYVHWLNTSSVTEPVQLEFNNTLFNESQYVQNNFYYVQGQYSAETGYTIKENDNITGNNLYLDENQNIKSRLDSSWNGISIAEFEGNHNVDFEYDEDITFVPTNDVGTGKKYEYDDRSGYLIDKASVLEYGDSINFHLYLGYGYMKGAYYTANGSHLDYVEQKVGEFKYAGNSIDGYMPKGSYGIDWVSRLCNWTTNSETDEKDDHSLMLYYQFVGVDTSKTHETENVYDYNSNNLTIDNGSSQPYLDQFKSTSIYIKLYPKSFTRQGLYDETIIDVDGYSINYNNLQDTTVYYINSKVLNAENSQGLSQNVKYYYWDGGYTIDISKHLSESGDAKVFTKVENLDAHILTYNDAGLQYECALSELKDHMKDYLVNPNAAEFSELNENDKNERLETYKVSNSYIYQNEILYEISNNYLVVNGTLVRTTPKIYNANDEDYNRNKYLINSDLQIYTRYKFTDGKIAYSKDDDSGNAGSYNPFNSLDYWVREGQSYKYFLFNNNENKQLNPNADVKNTTNLTESLLVTLGGGKNVKTSSSGSATTKSGSFNAK